MTLGNKYRRIAKQVNAALLSGAASQRQLVFLHQMSERIDKYGKNTHLTDSQLKWLSQLLRELYPEKPEKALLLLDLTEAGSTTNCAVDEIRSTPYRSSPQPASSNHAPRPSLRARFVDDDPYAAIPPDLKAECFGTREARTRNFQLITKLGRERWIEKLLRGDFDPNRPAGRPYVSD